MSLAAEATATAPEPTAAEMARRYAADGLLVVRNGIDRSVIDGLRAVVSGQVDREARELLAAGAIGSLHEHEPFERRLAAVYEECGRKARKWHQFLFCEEMYRLASAPGLVRALAAVLGSEVTFHGDYQMVVKLPGDEATAFPWHQDTQYYGVPSRHMHIVTAWVPLVNATEENGCLWVIPGSHRWGLLPAERRADLNFQCFEDVEQRAAARPVPLAPADFILMTNMTFHASRVNRSRGVRWSIDLGFSVTRGTRPVGEDERSSNEYLYRMLRDDARVPLVVHSADPGRVESWERWRDRKLAGAARQAAG